MGRAELTPAALPDAHTLPPPFERQPNPRKRPATPSTRKGPLPLLAHSYHSSCRPVASVGKELWQELWNRSPNRVLGQGPLRQGAVAERVYGTAATITAVPQLGRSSVSVSAHLVSTITSATLSTATLAATTEPPPLSPSPLSPPLPSPPPPSPPPPSPPPRHHLGAHLVSREERPGQGGGGVGGLHSRRHMGACCCSARARDAVYRAHQCPAPHEKHALHGLRSG